LAALATRPGELELRRIHRPTNNAAKKKGKMKQAQKSHMIQ
jgi:hypothetical protein